MKQITAYFLIFSLIIFGYNTFAQEETQLKEVALNIINEAPFCSLTTIDEAGFPETRMMQTLPCNDDFVIWLGTKPNTQKVEHINNNPQVSVYFTEANSTGYVNIQGNAEIVNDQETKEKHWKEGWEAFYENKETDFILIKVVPKKLQIVSYAKGIVSTEKNWSAKKIIFQ